MLFLRKTPKHADMTPFVGFEIVKAVVMKSFIFWIIMPSSPLKVNRSLTFNELHVVITQKRIS
jgi:hypothetical protein